jgi:hypothetical protein
MNLSQAESFLAKAKRTSDRTGRPVKNLPAVKTYDPRTDKARQGKEESSVPAGL